MICPKCAHEWKDKAKSEGGQKSKRRDMGKGSDGQKKAQAGRARAKLERET